MQVTFLWALVSARRHPKHTKNAAGQPLFMFTKAQKLAVDNLIAALKYPEEKDEFCLADAIYRVLYQIYFPDPSKTEDMQMDNVWANPFAVFCACLWVGKSGMYRPIFDITCFLTKLQCSMRLAFIRYSLSGISSCYEEAYPRSTMSTASSSHESEIGSDNTLDKQSIASEEYSYNMNQGEEARYRRIGSKAACISTEALLTRSSFPARNIPGYIDLRDCRQEDHASYYS